MTCVPFSTMHYTWYKRIEAMSFQLNSNCSGRSRPLSCNYVERNYTLFKQTTNFRSCR